MHYWKMPEKILFNFWEKGLWKIQIELVFKSIFLAFTIKTPFQLRWKGVCAQNWITFSDPDVLRGGYNVSPPAAPEQAFFVCSLKQASFALSKKAPARAEAWLFCRDDWIRTSDPYVPNVVRYRAALHPDPVKGGKNNKEPLAFQ